MLIIGLFVPFWTFFQCHCVCGGLAVFCVYVGLLYVWFLCVLFVPSVLWYCQLVFWPVKTVSHMTYIVLTGT